MFLFSLFLVLISSYLFTSIITQKETTKNLGLIYFFLICFSQIILNFEVLSLFSAISQKNFIIINIIFFITSIILWKKQNFIIYKANLREEIKKIKNALKRDKLLSFIGFCFIIFLICELFVATIYPITFGDVLRYTLTRCTTWIQNGNLNHFITPDTRELIMPINMELLYTWVLLFKKNEMGIGCFSYISYLFTTYTLYNFLGELNFCRRKRLWSIFVLSSFALVEIMAYTPCTDILIGTLILSSIYLFYISLKHNNKTALFFSSLSYALALGTKTTAFIMLPIVAIIYLVIIFKFKKDSLKIIFINYFLFFTINFLIFAAYNYVLNFIQFGNFISNTEQLLIHQFQGGIKGYLCNLIKYCFVFFDFSGIKGIEQYNNFISNAQTFILSLIGETPKSYLSAYFPTNFEFNEKMTITTAGFGILGLLALIPSIFKSFKYYKRNIILTIIGVSLFLNILLLSRTMLFCQYNIRYLTAFIVLSSPILVFSYIKSNKNIFKWILCTIMFIYLVGIPHTKVLAYTLNSHSVKIDREEIQIYNYIKKNNNNKNIALIASRPKAALYDIEKLKLIDYKIDKILVENIDTHNLDKYHFVITNKYKISSNNILNLKTNNQCLYFDSNMNIIDENNNNKPAQIECLIPFKYLNEKGFYKIEDLSYDNYVILEKRGE